MKLFIGTASPFARKARIVVREKQILPQVEEIITVPVQNGPDLIEANPLAQIPALATDHPIGMLTDSAFLSEWLDRTFTSGVSLLPEPDTEAYWKVRQAEILGAGLNEMLVKIVLEQRRPESERSPSWLKRWEENFLRGAERVDPWCVDTGAFDMGTLTLAIAGTYCTFRFPHLDWRSAAPRLAALTDAHEARQSFIDTYPKA